MHNIGHPVTMFYFPLTINHLPFTAVNRSCSKSDCLSQIFKPRGHRLSITSFFVFDIFSFIVFFSSVAEAACPGDFRGRRPRLQNQFVFFLL
jgi:hypothetical protein